MRHPPGSKVLCGWWLHLADSIRVIYRFLLQKGKGLLNVAPVLKHSPASLPTLQNTTGESVSGFIKTAGHVECWTERGLTRRWPLITSSRSNSLEPSRKSLNRSMTIHGGLRCHNTHTHFNYFNHSSFKILRELIPTPRLQNVLYINTKLVRDKNTFLWNKPCLQDIGNHFREFYLNNMKTFLSLKYVPKL